MTPPLITSLYAALLGGFFIYLSARTITARRDARIPVGTGDDKRLLRAMRAHGNFAEYAPLTLLLLAFAEMNGAWVILVHCLGALLIAGRFFHARGITAKPENFAARLRGMAMTFFALGGAAISAFGFAITGLFSSV